MGRWPGELLLFKGANNLLTVQLKAYLNLPSLIFVVKGGLTSPFLGTSIVDIQQQSQLQALKHAEGARGTTAEAAGQPLDNLAARVVWGDSNAASE